MRRFRFSLLGLAGATAAIGAACASLISASAWLAHVAWSVTLLALLFGLLCAVLSEPRRRGFWAGFALCGWIYVLIMFGPLSGVSALTPVDALLNKAVEAMPQSKGLDRSAIAHLTMRPGRCADCHGSTAQADVKFLHLDLVTLRDTSLTLHSGAAAGPGFVESFVRICHAWLALLLAAAGGLAGQLIRPRCSAMGSTPTSTSPDVRA